VAQRSSRKRRKRRQRPRADAAAAQTQPAPRGYARAREKDEAARAALEPLAPGERPTAVTVGAIVAAVLSLANIVALVAGYQPGDGDKPAITILGAALLGFVAWGMWRGRYWAVLGMQTILAIAILAAAIALVSAQNVGAALLVLVILAGSGTLFWFLIKAMARIQMPERPGARP
jgi:hypothetical protein